MRITEIRQKRDGTVRFLFDVAGSFHYADIQLNNSGFDVIKSTFKAGSEPRNQQIQLIEDYRNMPITMVAHDCLNYAINHFEFGETWEDKLWAYTAKMADLHGYSEEQKDKVVTIINARIDARTCGNAHG